MALSISACFALIYHSIITCTLLIEKMWEFVSVCENTKWNQNENTCTHHSFIQEKDVHSDYNDDFLSVI